MLKYEVKLQTISTLNIATDQARRRHFYIGGAKSFFLIAHTLYRFLKLTTLNMSRKIPDSSWSNDLDPSADIHASGLHCG